MRRGEWVVRSSIQALREGPGAHAVRLLGGLYEHVAQRWAVFTIVFCYELVVKMIFTAENLPDCHRQLSIQTCGENIRFYYELGVQILLAKAIFLVIMFYVIWHMLYH
jgi:hypothetical protein